VVSGTIAAGLVTLRSSFIVTSRGRMLTHSGLRIAFWVVLPSLLLGAATVGASNAGVSPRAIELFGWGTAVLASGMPHLIPAESATGVAGRVAASTAGGLPIFVVALAPSGDILKAIVVGTCGVLLLDPVVRAWRAGRDDIMDPPAAISEMRSFLVATWAAISIFGIGLVVLAVFRS
jgi:hypothetical protein